MRKPNRIQGFDYDRPGAYFVTICTEERQRILSAVDSPETVRLTETGAAVDSVIRGIPAAYPAVTIEEYVLMPDHVHLLLMIFPGEDGDFPKIDRIVGQMKRAVTKRIGRSIWQKSFYDHVIRNERDYNEIRSYIHENPARWFYTKSQE